MVSDCLKKKKTISITFPVAPLYSPISDHKFIVSITEASLARKKVGTNLHFFQEKYPLQQKRNAELQFD